MAGSVRLFAVRGIAVRVHFTFPLVMAWFAYLAIATGRALGGSLWPRLVFAELFVVLLFACVVLHELAHALAAQMFGVAVHDITLWPLGGIAHMARLPKNAFQEFVIAAAGPAMSIFLTLALGALLLGVVGPGSIVDLVTNAGGMGFLLGELDGRNLLLWLVLNNAILAIFNLIPAFPLDGGRLLRSALAWILPFSRATQVAVVIGQVMAGLFLVLAILSQNLVLALIAIFVFFSAGQERQQATISANLAGLRVQQAMQPLGQRLHPLQTLGQVATMMANSSQTYYVVVESGRLMGVLSRGDVLAALRQRGPNIRVSQQMTRDILRLAPDDSLATAREQMMQNSTWLALVVQDGSVVGTLSQGDIGRLGDLLRVYPDLLPRG